MKDQRWLYFALGITTVISVGAVTNQLLPLAPAPLPKTIETDGTIQADGFVYSGQGVAAIGNVEASGQFISYAGSPTPPLVVTSSAGVANLNADMLDGKDSASFALASELLAAITALDNPDPPCFDYTHRFVDCGNGTVTDTQTGLIWLQNPDCFGKQDYVDANASAAGLFDGSTNSTGGDDCELTDGSRAGDWRLPSAWEYDPILRAECAAPKIVGNGLVDESPDCYSDTPWANGVQADWYWTGTSTEDLSHTGAFRADLAGYTSGYYTAAKTATAYVWPVRGSTTAVP